MLEARKVQTEAARGGTRVRPVAVLAACAAALIFMHGVPSASQWSATEWVFSYETGFLRRGLAGEVLRRVLGEAPVPFDLVSAISLCVVILGALCLVALFAKSVPAARPGARAWLTGLILVSSPASVQMWSDNAGRLEQTGFVLTAMAMLALLQRTIPFAWKCGVAGAAIAVSALVHEATMLLFAPSLMAFALCDAWDGAGWPRRRVAAWAALVAMPAILVAGLLVARGRQTASAMDEHIRQVQARAGFAVEVRAVRHLSMTREQSLNEAFSTTAPPAKMPGWFVSSIILLLPTMLTGYTLWRGVYRSARGRDARVRCVLVLSSLLPIIALFFLGVDIGRWISWHAVMVLVTSLWFIARFQAHEAWETPVPFPALTISLAVAFNVVIGPIDHITGASINALRYFPWLTPQ